jgi:hypothetical protein
MLAQTSHVLDDYSSLNLNRKGSPILIRLPLIKLLLIKLLLIRLHRLTPKEARNRSRLWHLNRLWMNASPFFSRIFKSLIFRQDQLFENAKVKGRNQEVPDEQQEGPSSPERIGRFAGFSRHKQSALFMFKGCVSVSLIIEQSVPISR